MSASDIRDMYLQAQLCRLHEEEKRKNPADRDDPVTSAVTLLTRVEIWWLKYNLRVCLTIMNAAVSWEHDRWFTVRYEESTEGPRFDNTAVSQGRSAQPKLIAE